jgi:hypothetical protein
MKGTLIKTPNKFEVIYGGCGWSRTVRDSYSLSQEAVPRQGEINDNYA